MSGARFDRPIRILYMIDEMESITAGGTERQILQMIRLMRDAGAEMHLVVLRGTEWLNAEIAGCPVEFRSVRSLISPRGMLELWRLSRWIRRQKFDILQTFFVDSNIIGPIVGRLAGIRVIIGSRRNLNHLMSRRQLRAQRFADLFVTSLLANCSQVREVVSRTEHFPPDRIEVIYNGLDLEALRPREHERDSVRDELGIGPSEVLVGNISTLRAVKRIPEMVRAAARVRARFPQAKFVVVGEGPERTTIEQAIAADGLTGSFILTGAKEDVRPYLAALDIGVLCSQAEGLSNTILEYLAAGIPVVATDAGGNLEAVGDGGTIVPVGDVEALAEAIAALVADGVLRIRVGGLALRRAQQFTLECAAVRLVEVYTSVGHTAR
jgi:L-malate glycosyltransferase